MLPPELKSWLALWYVFLGAAVGAIISRELESKASFGAGLLGGIGKLFVLPAIGNRTTKEGLVSVRAFPWRSFIREAVWGLLA
jgi:hypothetical protein